MESVISQIQILWGSSFFSKCQKCYLDFENEAKNWEKGIFLWYNCIWIGIVKLSVLRIGYLSLAATGLKSSSKICYVNKRDFFQLNCLGSHHGTW